MPQRNDESAAARARRRALRAARAVTMGVALGGAAACSQSHDRGPAEDASVRTDAAMPVDSGPPDAGCTEWPPETEACCDAEGGFWDPGFGCSVAVPGPFVPPDVPA